MKKGLLMLASAVNHDPANPDGSGFAMVMAMLWFGWGGMWTLIWTAFAVNHTIKVRRGR